MKIAYEFAPAYHRLRLKTIKYHIRPYKIWFYDGTIYLIGHCRLRKEIRTLYQFRVALHCAYAIPFSGAPTR